MTVPKALGRRRDRRRSAIAATTPTARRRTATTRKTSTTSRGRPARITSSGRRASSTRRCRPCEMRLLLQPEHADQAERHFDATRAALKYYGEWFGAYPYGHITIVDPAFQSGAGGMEYPTLFTAGSAVARARARPTTRRRRWSTRPATSSGTASSAATSSRTRGWTRGSTPSRSARADGAGTRRMYLQQRYFGGFVPYVFKDIRARPRDRLEPARGLPARRRRAIGSRRRATATSPAWARSITYNKTALWLNTLERWLGWPTLQRIAVHVLRALAVQAPEAG